MLERPEWDQGVPSKKSCPPPWILRGRLLGCLWTYPPCPHPCVPVVPLVESTRRRSSPVVPPTRDWETRRQRDVPSFFTLTGIRGQLRRTHLRGDTPYTVRSACGPSESFVVLDFGSSPTTRPRRKGPPRARGSSRPPRG